MLPFRRSARRWSHSPVPHSPAGRVLARPSVCCVNPHNQCVRADRNVQPLTVLGDRKALTARGAGHGVADTEWIVGIGDVEFV